MATEFEVDAAGVELAGAVEEAPDSAPQASIVTLHGLTATRRTVVHGSRHLPRAGFRLIAYDARGHGASEAPSPGSYGYERLAADAAAVIDARVGEEGPSTPVLAGHSMGAHTAATLALGDPGRIAGLVLIGPAVTGEPASEESLAGWDGLADGIDRDGVEGFLAAYDQNLAPEWRETLLRVARQRLEAHEHIEGVAHALREVPRSLPFEGIGSLERLDVPALVVASHDEADPGHAYEIAEIWADALPHARLVSEKPGESPLAWQGGRLSREIEEFCRSEAVRERLD